MGKGSNTTSQQSTTSADPQAAALYRQLLGQAQGVASTPYQSYTGELTAGINGQQQTGINNVNSAAGFAQPYIQQAAGMVQGASSPLTSAQIQQYQNPYQQQVIDATMAQAAQGNAQQQAALKGNTIANGALGGNRAGVAQANLASQQSTALNSQLAALNSQNYTQGLATAQQQFQSNPLQAAYSLGNLGVSGQNAALSGAGAQIGAGTLQQNTQQAANTANYGQFMQQQAYPYQQLQWLAGLGTGVGSQLGGTSNGTTTAPAPNPWAQIAGLGIAGAGLFLKDGGAVKGPVRGFAAGGVPSTPWAEAHGWIPTMQIVGGRGAPSGGAPSAPSSGQSAGGDPFKQAQAMLGLSDGLRNRFSGEAYGGGSVFDGDESAYGGSSSHPLPGLSAEDYGKGFSHGGFVRGFAAGGSPSDFFSLTNGDPAWADPDIGTGYALPGKDSQTPFEARGGFGDLPPAKVNTGFLRAYSDADPRGADPRIESAIAENTVPLPRARPGEAPVGAPVMAADDEADSAGAPRAAVRGFAPSAAPVAANSNAMAPTARAVGDEQSAPGGFGFGVLSPAAKTGLLAAGLGMLASRSPNLGNAIGDGGMHGVNAYQGVKTAEAKQALDDRKLAQQADELAREAQKAASELALRTRAQSETERHNKASEQREFKPTYGVIGEDPVTGAKQMGWIDPNKLTTTPSPRISDAVGAPSLAGGIDQKLTGEEYISALQQRAPDIASAAKAVGDYKTPLTALSQRGGLREKVLAAALRYNPDFDSTQFTGKSRAVSNFAGGVEGRTVRSLNVAIDHLNTLDEAAKAMQNGNIPMLNGVVNAWRTKTGSPLATNFDSIKQVVSAEIAKSVVGGQTALHDRDDMAQRANNSGSPEQLSGIITEFKKLMAGQMNGLRHTYETSTRLKNFDDFLEPATKAELERLSSKGGGSGDKAGKSGGFTPPPGAVARVTKDGKTFYFDPATKQPYPGQ